MDGKRYQIELTTRDLILLLIERKGYSMEEAVRTVFTSVTYEKLVDTSTGLFFQSPLYVYAYLDKELTFGKIT